ncbi:MAG TPA: nitroreductase family protein, partial [Dehalococcoidia bacterium]|nr:nitroreductase family protein [Dehalococcoidia bacterium]
MEVKEVIGRRRTIRFFLPFRPVERAKIQKMLEAARHASCVGNVMNVRAIVIWKDQASPELIRAITPPLGYQQMQTAPVFILWYNETAAYEVNKWINDLHQLAET